MKINVINYGDFNICNVNIKIFDSNNNLITNDIIDKKTYYNLCNGLYVLKIFSGSNLLGIYPLIHSNDDDIFNIYLCSYKKDIFRTFFLYDYFYKGLKIQRGEIILGT